MKWCFNLYPLKLLTGCKNLISAHGTQPEVLMAQIKFSIKIQKENPCFFQQKQKNKRENHPAFSPRQKQLKKKKRHTAHKQAGAKQNRIAKLSKPEFTQSVKQGVSHHCSLQIQNSIYNEKEGKGICQCLHTRRLAPLVGQKKASLTKSTFGCIVIYITFCHLWQIYTTRRSQRQKLTKKALQALALRSTLKTNPCFDFRMLVDVEIELVMVSICLSTWLAHSTSLSYDCFNEV